MINSPEYQAARDEGFEIAEEYFMEAVREFYRDLKRKRLTKMATTTVVTTHKCNCEYCWKKYKYVMW